MTHPLEKCYRLEIVCDVNDGDYVSSQMTVTESELNRFRKRIEAVDRVRKSYTEYFSKDYRDLGNLAYYGKVRDSILTMTEHCQYGSHNEEELEGWFTSVEEEDIHLFMELDSVLPSGFYDEELPHTIESIDAFELVNITPIELL